MNSWNFIFSWIENETKIYNVVIRCLACFLSTDPVVADVSLPHFGITKHCLHLTTSTSCIPILHTCVFWLVYFPDQFKRSSSVIKVWNIACNRVDQTSISMHARIQNVLPDGVQLGVQLWQYIFFDEGKEDPNSHHRPSSETPFKRWWPKIECWLCGFVIFHGIQTSISKIPYIFVIFMGVRTDCPPLDPLLKWQLWPKTNHR